MTSIITVVAVNDDEGPPDFEIFGIFFRGLMTTSGHGPLTGQIVVSDGATLVYDILNPQGRTTVVLIHGWSGSRRYFKLNARDIAAAGHRVIAYDQRFHGDSSRPGHGHSVARLAADLQTLLEKLEVRNACCVGTSMGAAVIWAYQELFGTGDRIASIVTVDQGMYGDIDAAGSRQFSRAARLCLLATSTAPLQNIVPGWRLGSTGCYDQYTLALLQSAVRNDFTKFAHENAAFCCDTNNIEPEILEMLADETLKADPEALCKLMADHTARDWRDVLGTITVPCLNVVGRVSKVFPWEGVAAVSDKLVSSSDVQTEYFDYNHWLYLESPEQFNELVAGFARSRWDTAGSIVT